MSTKPTVASVTDEREEILAMMKKRHLRSIPILDGSGLVVGLRSLMDIVHPQSMSNLVVLMAGGLGTRLWPLTKDCPKPFLNVGGKPLLETIIEEFIEQGFSRFRIAVNYMANVIENYFGDGNRYNGS